MFLIFIQGIVCHSAQEEPIAFAIGDFDMPSQPTHETPQPTQDQDSKT